jgi:hypothetical protein
MQDIDVSILEFEKHYTHADSPRKDSPHIRQCDHAPAAGAIKSKNAKNQRKKGRSKISPYSAKPKQA